MVHFIRMGIVTVTALVTKLHRPWMNCFNSVFSINPLTFSAQVWRMSGLLFLHILQKHHPISIQSHSVLATISWHRYYSHSLMEGTQGSKNLSNLPKMARQDAFESLYTPHLLPGLLNLYSISLPALKRTKVKTGSWVMGRSGQWSAPLVSKIDSTSFPFIMEDIPDFFFIVPEKGP